MYSNMLHLPCCLSVHSYIYNSFVHNNVCIEFNSSCQYTLMVCGLFSEIYEVVRGGGEPGNCCSSMLARFERYMVNLLNNIWNLDHLLAV